MSPATTGGLPDLKLLGIICPMPLQVSQVRPSVSQEMRELGSGVPPEFLVSDSVCCALFVLI